FIASVRGGRGLLLEDVDAAGVGAGHETALLENDGKQLVDVALRGHRPRDVDQLAELVAIAPQPLAAALGAALRLEQLEGANAREENFVERSLLRDDAREAAIHRLLEIDVARVAHEDEHRRRLGEARGEGLQELAPS